MEREKVIRQLFDERLAVMAYLNSIVHDRHHAEDLFQDISVEAIEKGETIEDAQHLTRWLRTASRYRAIDHLRRKGNRALTFEPELMDKLDQVWQEAAGDQPAERVEALRQCMGHMPKGTREIIRLRYEDNRTGSQIAEDTGRSSNAIYLALSRAHKALRDCIEQRLRTLDTVRQGGDSQ